MAVITLLFDVNDTVYHIDAAKGVRKGTVSAIDVMVRPSSVPLGYTTVSSYTIHLMEGAGIVTGIDESSLDDNLDDALATYKTMIE